MIDFGNEFGLEFFRNPGELRRGHGERSGLSAAEAHMNGDRIGFEERDVLDQEREEPFTLACFGEWIVPHARKIMSEREDAFTRLFAEQSLVGLVLTVLLLCKSLQMAQGLIPLGFERIGHQSVIGIAFEKSPAFEFGLVAGAFDVLLTKCIGLLDTSGDLLLDGEGHLDRRRCHGFEQQRTDGGIDLAAANRLTHFACMTHGLLRTRIVGHEFAPAAALVARAHPFATARAQNVALQERRAFTGQRATASRAARGEVFLQGELIALELLPGDVAGVSIGDQDFPVLTSGPELVHGLQIGATGGARASIDEGTGVAWIMQEQEEPAVLQWMPAQLTRPVATAQPIGKLKSLALEAPHGGIRGVSLTERCESQSDDILDLPIRVEHDTICGVVDESDGQREGELAAAGLVEEAAAQSRLDHVHLGLRDSALQSEEEPIIEVGGVVEAILIADDSGGERAELQEVLPIDTVASESRDLDPEHDAGVAEGDFADEVLKAIAVVGVFGRMSQVGIDNVYVVERPAERERAIAQGVLALSALDVLDDLPLSRLSQVNEGIATQMIGGHLRMGLA